MRRKDMKRLWTITLWSLGILVLTCMGLVPDVRLPAVSDIRPGAALSWIHPERNPWHLGAGEAFAGLVDTGRDECYSAYPPSYEITCPSKGEYLYGQDAQYRGVQPAYRDNGDGTVTDLNTGYMWQQGDSQNNRKYTFSEANDYCSALNLAGYSDWYLPSITQLISLIDIRRNHPSIDIDYFPDCIDYGYWSDQSSYENYNYAWYVNFSYGNTLTFIKNYAGVGLHVRCVR